MEGAITAEDADLCAYMSISLLNGSVASPSSPAVYCLAFLL